MSPSSAAYSAFDPTPSTSSSSSSSSSQLRPLKAPFLPAELSALAASKGRLVRLQAQLAECESTAIRLETITDEVSWDANVPVGPLAFFKGRLVHTNDIFQLSKPFGPDPSSSSSSSLKQQQQHLTAKRARSNLLALASALKEQIAQASTEVAAQEKKAKALKHEGRGEVESGWVVNEKGELINEEGMPLFDIQEEVPFAAAEQSDPKAGDKNKNQMRPFIMSQKRRVEPSSINAGSTGPKDPSIAALFAQVEAEEEREQQSLQQQQQQLEGEIVPWEQEEGQQGAVGGKDKDTGAPVPPPHSVVPTATASKPSKSSAAAPGPPPPKLPAKADFLPGFSSGFLGGKKTPVVRGGAKARPASMPPVSSSSSSGTPHLSNGSKRPVSQLVSSSSPSSSSLPPPPLPPSSASTASPPSSPRHEPLHRLLPAPSPISSRPHSRSSSPSRRVVFDLPAEEEEEGPKKPPKEKKRVWILPPPPGAAEQGQGSPLVEEVKPSPSPSPVSEYAQDKEKDSARVVVGGGGAGGRGDPLPNPKAPPVMGAGAQRPVKETVVERPMMTFPTAPRAGGAVGAGRKLGGLGGGDGAAGGGQGAGAESKTPKAAKRVSSVPFLPPSPPLGGSGGNKAGTRVSGVPLTAPASPRVVREREKEREREREREGEGAAVLGVHTVHFGKTPREAGDGHVALEDILSSSSDDEEDDPSQYSHDSDSDSFPSPDGGGGGALGRGVYDSDSDDFEVDIDEVLHAREVAREYHERRMGVAAGAGTGPLGGDREPDAYDSWNQPVVPNEAQMLGRVPGTSKSSRFRKGRLESTQMILPTLINQHLVDPSADSAVEDEEDGFTAEERENIRKKLEEFATGQPPIVDGLLKPTAAAAVRERVVERPIPPPLARRPPTVESFAVKKQAGGEKDKDKRDSTAKLQKPKRVSRFKAERMGLVEDE